MDIPDDPRSRRKRAESLLRAVALGEELMRLTDELGLTVAGLHVCQGVEMLREEADRPTGG